ncbi:MAG: hypothetical protein RL609_1983 [Bacteroidota bacterium]|jgi:uncharacterized membrane protein
MRRLKDAEVAWIASQLDLYSISDTEWKESLLDHICSSIEEREESTSIEEAFEWAKGQFLPEEWKTIEIKIKQNMENEKMKTVLRTLGGVSIVSAIFLVTGSILKITHAQGAAAMLWSGIALMGIIGGPILGYLLFKADQKKMDWFLMLLLTFFVVRFSYGVMARIQHWDNAAWTMIFSIAGFVLVYLPINFTHEWRKSEQKFQVIWKHALMLMVCVMLFTLFDLRAM